MAVDPFEEIRCPDCGWVHFRELGCPDEMPSGVLMELDFAVRVAKRHAERKLERWPRVNDGTYLKLGA